MAISNSQQYQRTGSYVPTTQVWDQAQIQNVNVNSQEFKNLLVRLYQYINQMALVLNGKSTGAYYLQEFVTGDMFFPNPANTSSTTARPLERNVSRSVVNFGALPNIGIKSVPHNLNPSAIWTFTKIYGCSTNPSTFGGATPQQTYIPLPYVDATGAAANNIELFVDATNVNIRTQANYSAWTTTYVVLEWITL